MVDAVQVTDKEVADDAGMATFVGALGTAFGARFCAGKEPADVPAIFTEATRTAYVTPGVKPVIV